MKKIIFTLFLLSFFCGFANAQDNSKIDIELQKVLNHRNEELIDIQVYFKSNVDSNKLKQASRNASTKSEKKDFVVNELKTYSENIQSDVLSILEAEKLNGTVADINCLWISNTLSCKASRDVIYKISSHPDVKIVGYDKEFQMLSPQQMKESIEAKPANVRGPFAHVVSVNADDVWEQGYTGKNVVVAVLDSGTNTEHVDLKDHLWSGHIDTDKDGTPDTYVNGWNFDGDNSDITDEFGHGTHCAGIVCGDGTSGNTTGIAPDASLMTVKIINRAGGGSVSQMLSGVQFAVENGADVLSMSLGFKNSQLTTAQKEEIRKAFDNVLSAGVIVCAAAGNDGDTYGAPDNVDYPAACPAPWRNPDQTLEGGLSSVICVGAHDLNESSRGPSTWEGTSYNDYPYNSGASMGLIRPDISAPGYFIYSSKHNGNNDNAVKSGTSQATPCVAGVIALMLEKNSTLTPAQISQIIEETAAAKPEKKNNTVGAGVVDALAAVNGITEVTEMPYVKMNTFSPATISAGNSTLGITLKNEGNGPSDENTTVTLYLANDPYVTIANPTQTIGTIGVNNTKTLYFELDINPTTPNGHTATFTVTTTSDNYKWDDVFYINITASPKLTFQSVSPGVVKPNTTTDIRVTMVNDGTADFSGPITLKLVSISSSLKHLTLINDVTTIHPLDVNETGTGTFTIETKEPKDGFEFDFFLETYSENIEPKDYVYEFENDMQGWTSFNASSNDIKTPWNHSSNANSVEKKPFESHTGKGHLMSHSGLKMIQYTYPIDNYLVSPAKVKITENSKVSFYARAHYTAYYKEHFGLAVSTTGNTSANDFTTIEEWKITESSTSTTWKQYTVDLSDYAGQEIYIAIRHFFTNEEWNDPYQADGGLGVDALNIDDIAFSNVIVNTKHVSTYSLDDPYYFNVTASSTINLPEVKNITATLADELKISLSWNAVNNVNKYNVYRNGQKIATVTEPAYVDTELSYETQYCYAVTTITSSGESGFSEEVCETTLEPTSIKVPTNLTAEAISESEIALKWDEVKEAASYNVYQDTKLIATGLTTTMYIVNGLTSETEYCFSITAVNKIAESDKSEKACATTFKEKPIAPVVTAIATSDSEITLTWNEVENALSYKVYQGTEALAIELTETTYTIENLEAETKYCFNVTAVNEIGESEKSEDACATTLEAPKAPAAPVVTATADGESSIILRWDAVENALSYNIYRGTETLAIELTETTYTIENLEAETIYCFNVTAVNEVGESELSENACATTDKKLTGVIVKSYELTAQTGEATLTATLINKCEKTTPAATTATLVCDNEYVNIINGTYNVGSIAVGETATATFNIELAENIPSNYDLDFEINIIVENEVISESFSNKSYTFDNDLQGCTTITADNHYWYHSSTQSSHGYNKSYSNGGFVFSESFCNKDNKTLTPDRWLVMPEQIIPSDGTTFEFYVCSMANQTKYAMEKFGVFVSTTSNTDVNSFKQVDAWTLAKNSNSLKMTLKSSMLVDYEGQNIWVAIRHFDCGDNAALAVDDIIIYNVKSTSTHTEKTTYPHSFTVTVNPSTNIFTGIGSWDDASNWSKGSIPTATDDVIIDGDVTITSGDIIVESITINSGSLTIDGGVRLTVNSTMTNTEAASLIINDGAQLFQSSENVFATFNMNIVNPTSWTDSNKDGWQFIASPFNSSSVINFTGNEAAKSYDLYKYEGTEWDNHKKGNNIDADFEKDFVNGRGYLASYETESSVSLTGTLYNKDYFEFEDVSYNKEKTLANFHLLGNPFPFNMDMRKATVEGLTIGYAIIGANGAYIYAPADTTIAAGDGFFVKAIAAEPTFSYNHKKEITRSSRQFNSINVIVSGKTGKDNVIINFAGQSEGFDKLQNFNEEIATVFVANEGKRYGIANLDENVSEVELSFVASQMGNYSISLDINGEFESVVLTDRFTGIETNMLIENEYSFTATSNDTHNRFVVKLDNRQQTTDNRQFVYQSGDELIIKAEGRIQIIDMMGRVVYTTDIVGEDNRVNVSNFNKTAYVIRNINENAVRTQKIVIL